MRTDNLNLDSRGKHRLQTFFDPDVEPSLTVQSDREQADINSILRKYKSVGIIEHLNNVDAQFLDVSEFTDYSDMMRNLKIAETEFLTLPSKVREVFGHDVAKWLDSAHATSAENQELFEATGAVDPPPTIVPEIPAETPPESPA